MDTARVGPGKRVLIRAAAGGVGHLAAQFAKLRGAYVLASSAGDRLDFVRSLGADEAVGGRRDDFLTLVREADVVPDVVQRARPHSQELLGPGGLLIAVGQLEYPQVPSATTVLVEPDYAVLEENGGLLAESRLRVEAEAVFPLEAAPGRTSWGNGRPAGQARPGGAVKSQPSALRLGDTSPKRGP